jgi:hypothetical protein
VGVVSAFIEFPVWVPMDDERLAAVVCAPDGEVEDLGVLLLTGGNYTRAHRNRMWVRAARELARLGVPSIRVDYHGVGDSTGRVVFGLEDPLVADAVAAADFLKRAAGTRRLAIVATCFGGRAAAAASAVRDDVVATTVFPLPVEVPATTPARPPLRRRLRRWLKGSELGARVLRDPRVKRARVAVAERRPGSALVVSPRFRRDVGGAARRGTVRFVFGETSKELPGLRRLLDELRDELEPDAFDRIEVEVVRGTDLGRFQTLADQEVVVDRAVRTALRVLGREPTRAAT